MPISGTDDEVNAALIRLRALGCQPIPLDSALSALGACLGQAFRDGDAKVDCRSRLELRKTMINEGAEEIRTIISVLARILDGPRFPCLQRIAEDDVADRVNHRHVLNTVSLRTFALEGEVLVAHEPRILACGQQQDRYGSPRPPRP